MKKKPSLIFMIAVYAVAGINHFIMPDFYEGIMPHWLPEHALTNTLSGIAEIFLAILLLFPLTQRLSAWGIVLMLAIFLGVIHIPMALDFKGWDSTVWWISIARLPLQYVLIVWALRFTSGKLVYFRREQPQQK